MNVIFIISVLFEGGYGPNGPNGPNGPVPTHGNKIKNKYLFISKTLIFMIRWNYAGSRIRRWIFYAPNKPTRHLKIWLSLFNLKHLQNLAYSKSIENNWNSNFIIQPIRELQHPRSSSRFNFPTDINKANFHDQENYNLHCAVINLQTAHNVKLSSQPCNKPNNITHLSN